MVDRDEVFRKYVMDTCNNQPMVDAVVNLHKEAGTDDDGLFAQMLYQMLPSFRLCQDICNIRDIIFDLGSKTELDPSYHDAVVETEARPKNASISFVVPLEDNTYQRMADSLHDMKKSYHDRVFNPMTTEHRPKNQYDMIEEYVFNHR